MGSGLEARGSEERYAVQICDFPEVDLRGRPVRRYFPEPIVLPESFILVEEVEEDPKENRPAGLGGGGSDCLEVLFLADDLFLLVFAVPPPPPLGLPSLYFDPLAVDTVMPCLHSAFFVANVLVVISSPSSISGSGWLDTVPMTPPRKVMLQLSINGTCAIRNDIVCVRLMIGCWMSRLEAWEEDLKMEHDL